MPEYVSLVDRPGRYFVVSRVLGRLQLLGPGDEELSVSLDQVRVSLVGKPTRGDDGKPMRDAVKTTDFSQYGEFIAWLVAHRERVYFSLEAQEHLKPEVCDKYLELAGEELDPERILTKPKFTSQGTKCWWALGVYIIFPGIPDTMLTPSPRRVIPWNRVSGTYQNLSCVKFFWHLVEHYDFRVKTHEG